MRLNRTNGWILLAVIILSGIMTSCGTGKSLPSASRQVLGTTVTITVYDAGIKQKDMDPVFKEIFDVMADWEKKVLIPGPENQVNSISRGAGQQSIPADEPVFDMLMKALQLYDASGKVFDIRYGPMLDAWGFDTKPHVPTPAALDSLKPLVTDGGMFVAGNSILLARKGMRFDTREIAAGYAFDLAAAKLGEKGLHTAVISSPNLCRTMGDPPDKRGFKVRIADPAGADSAWATVWIPAGGMAYTNPRSGQFTSGGKSYHSHLDPRTGMPADKCVGAVVQAGDAATAQAMAYSVYVLGGTDGLEKDGKAAVGGYVVIRNEGGKLNVMKNGSLADHFESKQ
jgi:FAD:protein FMN transferase